MLSGKKKRSITETSKTDVKKIALGDSKLAPLRLLESLQCVFSLISYPELAKGKFQAVGARGC